VPCGRRCRALERGALHTLRRTPADRRRQVFLCRTRTRQVRQRRGRSGVVVAAASSHRVKTADVPGRVHGCLEHLLHHRRSVVQVKKVRARHPTISLRLWYVGEQTASTSRRASGRHASRTCTAACAASTRLCLTPPAHGQLNAVSLVPRLPCPSTATSAALKPAIHWHVRSLKVPCLLAVKIATTPILLWKAHRRWVAVCVGCVVTTLEVRSCSVVPAPC